MPLAYDADGEAALVCRAACYPQIPNINRPLPLHNCHRLSKLQRDGFVFLADEAEWQRWYGELLLFKDSNGHCNPMPLATGADMYLINW